MVALQHVRTASSSRTGLRGVAARSRGAASATSRPSRSALPDSCSLAVRRQRKEVAERGKTLQASSSKGEGSGGFWSGVLVGGTVFGVLGFLFAPQVSRALLNSDRMKKLLGDGNENLEVTREMLNDKISELNSAIDGVSQQLQSSSKENQVENM